MVEIFLRHSGPILSVTTCLPTFCPMAVKCGKFESNNF